MSRYGGSSRERLVLIYTGDVGAAPTRNQAPHLVISPRTAGGLITGNLAIVLLAPNVSPAVEPLAGFTLDLYRSLPTVGEWGSLLPRAACHYKEQYVMPDIAGGWGIYFRIANAASSESPTGILVGVAELP